LARLVRRVKGLAPQDVIIDGIVHIGRSPNLVDYRARVTPAAFKDAETIIVVREPNSLVSRNHLLIYPPDATMTTFSLLDLNSANGTFVNGKKIGTAVRIPLNAGDVIDLGGIEKVQINPENGVLHASARFTFTPLAATELKHLAVMVGQPGWNLQGVGNDLDQLGTELRARHFEVEALQNGAATEAAIIGRIAMAKRALSTDSLFVFYFSGHGTRNGDLVIGTSGQTISLARIFAEMQGLRGQKLVILDGCYTAATLDSLAIPARTNIIGHTALGFEGPIESMDPAEHLANPPPFDPVDPFAGLGGVSSPVMGFMTRALVRELQASTSRIDFNQLVQALTQDPRILKRQIGVRAVQHTMLHLASRVGDDLP
jgi:hypothetical protein